MRRHLLTVGLLAGMGIGSVGLLSGCEGDQKTGTMVKVTEEQKVEQQKREEAIQAHYAAQKNASKKK